VDFEVDVCSRAVKVCERSRYGQSHNKSSSKRSTVLTTFKAPRKGWNREFFRSKNVLTVLPTGFGKSLLFQLIPGLCVELHNAPDAGVPDELEQHLEYLFLPFVASPFQQTRFFL